jgi:hypothetical protein
MVVHTGDVHMVLNIWLLILDVNIHEGITDLEWAFDFFQGWTMQLPAKCLDTLEGLP